MWEINLKISPKYGFIQCSNIHKMKIIASSPIIFGETGGETMDTVTDFIFLGSKVTADSDFSRDIKRLLLLVEKLWLT